MGLLARWGSVADAPTVSAIFAADPASGAHARQFVSAACEDWNLPGVIPDAQLVVTELVENAVRHGPSESHVMLSLLPSGLLITARDAVHDEPRPMLDRGDRAGGRGLLIVERLSIDWGVEAAASGKSVWALLPLPVHNEAHVS